MRLGIDTAVREYLIRRHHFEQCNTVVHSSECKRGVVLIREDSAALCLPRLDEVIHMQLVLYKVKAAVEREHIKHLVCHRIERVGNCILDGRESAEGV